MKISIQLILVLYFLSIAINVKAQDVTNEGDAVVHALDPIHAGAIFDDGTTLLDGPFSIFVSGDYAYIASIFDDAVEILNISDPTNPTHVGSISDDDTTLLLEPRSIFVLGDYAYVVSGEEHGVEILDVSDPTNPTHAGSISDNSTSALVAPQSIFVSGNFAYVCSYSNPGVQILDVSDPTNPIPAGLILDNATTSLHQPESIVVRDDYAYVVSQSEGVEILDVSDPYDPIHLSATSTTLRHNSIYVTGDYAYLASFFDDGVEVLDISDPANPILVGIITDDDITELRGAISITVAGDYAYVAGRLDHGVEILNISDPANPTHAGAISWSSGTALTGANSIVVVGDYAYIAGLHNDGVEILDISGIKSSSIVTDTLIANTVNIDDSIDVTEELSASQDLAIINRNLTSEGSIHTEKYTQLGEQAPAMKLKIIESTTAANQGGNNPVAHGLDSKKILSVDALVRYSSSNEAIGILDEDKYFNGYELSLSWNATNINVLNEPGNSGEILNKSVVISIMYIE